MHPRRLIRHFLADAGRSAYAGSVACLLVSTALFGSALLRDAVVLPDPWSWMRAMAFGCLAWAPVWLPLVASGSVLAVCLRWRFRGDAEALASSGGSMASLTTTVAWCGVLTMLLTLWACVFGEPWARRSAEHIVQQASTEFYGEQRTFRIGGLEVVKGPDAVLLRQGSVVAVASSLQRDSSGVWTANDVLLEGDGVRGKTRRLVVSAPETSPSAPSLGARSTRALWSDVVNPSTTERERARRGAVLAKRFLHPLGAGLAPLAVLAFRRARTPWGAFSLFSVAWLGVVRWGDHATEHVGPASALFGLAYVGAVLLAGARR